LEGIVPTIATGLQQNGPKMNMLLNLLTDMKNSTADHDATIRLQFVARIVAEIAVQMDQASKRIDSIANGYTLNTSFFTRVVPGTLVSNQVAALVHVNSYSTSTVFTDPAEMPPASTSYTLPRLISNSNELSTNRTSDERNWTSEFQDAMVRNPLSVGTFGLYTNMGFQESKVWSLLIE